MSTKPYVISRRNAPGKYLVINISKFVVVPTTIEELIDKLVQHPEAVEFDCGIGQQNEAFVIKLKDIHSRAALMGYAISAKEDEPGYAQQVKELAERSGIYSRYCKTPD